MAVVNESLAGIYPLSSRLAGELPRTLPPADFPAYLAAHPHRLLEHPYLPDLAALELTRHQMAATAAPSRPLRTSRLNPTVRIVEVAWTGLPEFLRNQSARPQRVESLVLLYRPTPGAAVVIFTPNGHDLLALKMVLEGITSQEAAVEADITIGKIDAILVSGSLKRLILSRLPPLSVNRAISRAVLPTPSNRGCSPLPSSGT